jgi:hypothetical protein
MIAQAPRRHARTNPVAAESGTQPKVEGRLEGSSQISAYDSTAYILSMIAELRCLAEATQLRFLAYLLEMAFQEAFRLTSELEKAQAIHKTENGERAGPETTT